MDIDADAAQPLLEATLQQLARFGLIAEKVGHSANGCNNTTLSLRWNGGKADYRAEVKRGLRPSTFGSFALHIKQLDPEALLITDYVSPPLAEQLKEYGIQFVDAAGNAYLNHESLLIWVKGERPSQRLRAPVLGRAFQPTGLRVLFSLLAVPGLMRKPYRVIAEHTGVAHGTVGIVMTELSKLGFLAEIGGQRRLLQPERLMRQWVEGYARTLRPKLLLKTFRASTIGWWQTLDTKGLGLVLGGEAAAARITGIIEPEIITLYGSKAALTGFMIKHPMEPNDGGNVEVLNRFWHFEHEPPELTPPLLTYADLLVTGDARCLEAAQALEAGVVDRLAR